VNLVLLVILVGQEIRVTREVKEEMENMESKVNGAKKVYQETEEEQDLGDSEVELETGEAWE
jgi:hypothetical protein